MEQREVQDVLAASWILFGHVRCILNQVNMWDLQVKGTAT